MNELSPLDGRYRSSTESLRPFFSEEALIRARIEVELRYFVALSDFPPVREVTRLRATELTFLEGIVLKFSAKDVERVKALERTTKHDVKAVEYFLKEKFERNPRLRKFSEFLHFGLTSEDVNNLAYGLLIHRSLKDVLLPELRKIENSVGAMARQWAKVSLLSLTHGQPATPTTVGKEFAVFADRLTRQRQKLQAFRMQGKLGGAVGTWSAHKAAYPEAEWEQFGKKFVRSLGLDPLPNTTQINPHDDLAELSHFYIRVDSILLDLARDLWLYISRGVFKQKTVAGEVGSSTMPHKVNPIDFENAEGNLGLASALFDHFALKLPVSRLQRDLSDSTVQRNIGVAFGYHLLALVSLSKGLKKLMLDRALVARELRDHPEVHAEAIQTLLRKHGVTGAYEKLKKLTRGEKITVETLKQFLSSLPLSKGEKERLSERF